MEFLDLTNSDVGRQQRNTQSAAPEIVCMVDRSGSMKKVRHSAIEGFNNFLKDQRHSFPDARLTVVLFNHEWKVLHSRKQIQYVPELNEISYAPRGKTSLRDCIVRTIQHISEKHRNVIFMILTDGQDTSSVRCSKKCVLNYVDSCSTNLGWEFHYVTTCPKAYDDAKHLGILPTNTHLFKNTNDGMTKSFAALSELLKETRD